MLEEMKEIGEIVSVSRKTENSLYVEGKVKKVYEDEGEYFYEIVWEDGKHAGEIFYEAELDEPDPEQAEALLRASFSELIETEALDAWFENPNKRLKGIVPFIALPVLGIAEVQEALLQDYLELTSSEGEENYQSDSEEEELENQMKDIFG